MDKVRRNSYLLLLGTIVLAGWFGLGVPLITVLFSYFVLNRLHFLRRNWLTVSVFLVLMLVFCAALAYFVDQAIKTLPGEATKAIPLIIEWAKKHNLELPFSDWDSLKSFALENIQGELHAIGNFAKIASKQFVFLVIGVVIAVSLFLNPATDLGRTAGAPTSLYALYCDEIAARFRSLYQSFATVMGAQLIISSINTALTGIFIFAISMPYAPLMVGVTFLCGLLPIVGNLISNSIIVIIAFTVKPELAIWALVFLVVLHKLEYFLNSKIIGHQIKNPVWLTMVGLVIGERLMGITGMILAPVILYFIKLELSQIKTLVAGPEGKSAGTRIPSDAPQPPSGPQDSR